MDKLRSLAVVFIALAVMTMAIPAFGLASFSTEQTQSGTSHDTLAPTKNTQNSFQNTQNSFQEAPNQDLANHQYQSGSQDQSDDRSVAEILRNARQSYSEIKDINATLVMTTEISNETTTLASNSAKARLSFERPDKFRIELLEPEAQAGTVIVSNGTTITFYNPQTGTVRTINTSVFDGTGMMDMGAGTGMMDMGAMDAPMAGSFGQVQSVLNQTTITFEGAASVAGHETYVLSVTPENTSEEFSAGVTLYLDKQTYLPVKIVSETSTTLRNETITTTTTVVVRDLQVNTGIPDSVFEFEAPSNVDVDDGEAPPEEDGDDGEQPVDDGADEGDEGAASVCEPGSNDEVLGENDEDDDGDGAIDEDDEDNEGPSNDDDDGDGHVDEDDECDDGDDGSDEFNGEAEDDDDGDGAVDEDDEPDSGNSDDVDNDGDGAVDEDDELDNDD